MTIDARCYPVLRPKTILQRTPEGARLHLRAAADEARPWKTHFTNSVNMDACRLLELCTGALDVAGIASRYNAAHSDRPIAEEKAVAFFRKAAEQRLIEARPAPCGSPDVTLCGDHLHRFPAHVAVELTDRCNYACRHCYRSSGPACGASIPTRALLGFLEGFRRNGGVVVELTGGEPMLHPDFFKIVDWCCERFCLVGLLSNGYFLQEEALNRLLPHKERLLFSLSLDSHRADYHDRFRGKEGAHARTLNAMRLLGENGCFYRVSMSVTRENFFDIEDTLLLAKRLGARAFGFNPVMDVGRGEGVQGPLIDDPDEARALLEYEASMHKRHRGFIAVLSETQQASLRKGNCGLLSKSVVLSPRGVLRPCLMFDDAFEIGSIHEADYETLFRSERLRDLAELPAPGPEVCGGCPHGGYCRGCVLRGLKRASETPRCAWAEKNGAARRLARSRPSARRCHNVAEPVL